MTQEPHYHNYSSLSVSSLTTVQAGCHFYFLLSLLFSLTIFFTWEMIW